MDTTKIYARQIDPRYQKSPLFYCDEDFPDNIIVTGNRAYNSHTTPAWDQMADYWDDMAWDWENRERGDTLRALLYNYGFERPDGKPWTTKERHLWRELLESGEDEDDDEVILPALALLTRKPWDTRAIRGCCQGEYQRVYYSPDEWSEEALDEFEIEYFNTGTEWIVHDEEQPPEYVGEISGYCTYCHGWTDEQNRAEIANAAGVDPEQVILYDAETPLDTPIEHDAAPLAPAA